MPKLTDKTALTEFADGDLIHVVDISDTTSSAEGTSKKSAWSLIVSTLLGSTRIFSSIVGALRFRSEVNVETLSAGRSILTTDKQNQLLDPNGANRDVTLYASPTAGDYFLFRNSGTSGFNLVLKNNAGTTLVTIGNGVVVAVLYNGTNWILV